MGTAITFLGGAGTVTGSKVLVESAAGSRVLVDCGAFQGRKELRLRNWEPAVADPGTLDVVVLTHAHVDHCGMLPRIVAAGFRGPVLATPGTVDLARIVLPDAAHLHEEEAAYANRVGSSKHRPALPLFTRDDAARAIALLRAVPFHQRVQVAPGVHATWHPAGHILGAAWIELEVDGRRIAMSGDLGRQRHPLLRPPEPLRSVAPVDALVLESTYGDEEHAADATDAVLGAAVRDAARSGGVVLIPAFAVDRTEIVLHALDRLVGAGEVPSIPVVLDSPMASAALAVYRAAALAGHPELRPEVHGRTLFGQLDLTETPLLEASKQLNGRAGPLVIVSASGMATGGRVLHHLAARAGDPRTTILLVGFQAPGTRGAALASGASEIKLFGAYRHVAADVRTVALSAHADRPELLDWAVAASPGMVLVNHGEPPAAAALVDALRSHGRRAVAVRHGERVLLGT